MRYRSPITAISLATGFSTQPYGGPNRLEEKGAIKIEKSDDQREAQRIIPLNRSDETNKVFDYWLTQSEDLVKLSYEILKDFRSCGKLIRSCERGLKLIKGSKSGS